jgi:hypothetical protein
MERTYQSAAALVSRAAGPLARLVILVRTQRASLTSKLSTHWRLTVGSRSAAWCWPISANCAMSATSYLGEPGGESPPGYST